MIIPENPVMNAPDSNDGELKKLNKILKKHFETLERISLQYQRDMKRIERRIDDIEEDMDLVRDEVMGCRKME